MKIKKCIGCGVELQEKDINKEGYIKNNSIICERCFRLKNYNEYQKTTKTNKEYIKILNDINNSDDLVLYIVDVFNLNFDINIIFKYIKKNILLVLTKKDILPKSIKENKIKEYFSGNNFLDIIYISSKNNYNLDNLYKLINKYKKSNNVYVVGKTNSGKSTLINKFIKNYSILNTNITTSYMPSTTLDTIKIKINDKITFIDTPGLIDEEDIINYINIKEIKQITPKNEIKPKTFQISNETSIIVFPFARIDTNCNNNFTFFLSNELSVKKNNYNNDKLKDLKKHDIKISEKEDLVINGLLWIKIQKPCELVIYTYDNVLVYKRKSLI